MAWHVLTGRYYMAYDTDDPNVKVQPYDLFGRTEGYSAVVVFEIENGLVGSGLGCDPSKDVGPDNPETHIDVSGVTFALAARWKPGEQFFLSGGTGRLYFGPAPTSSSAGTSDTQKDLIVDLFTNSNNDKHLGAFQSISNWTTNHARLTGDMKPGPVGGATQIHAPTSPVQTGGGANINVGGTLKLVPRTGLGADYSLLHAEPAFRAGGQISRSGISIDIEGATLATVAASTWTDQELGLGNMKVDGHGESRSFLWADEEHSPFAIQAILRLFQMGGLRYADLAHILAGIQLELKEIRLKLKDPN